MICPVCKSDMIIVERNDIELDYCPECRGVWFDAGELELLLEASGLDSSAPLLEEMLGGPEAATTEKKRKCPICRGKMKKSLIDRESGTLVDVCRDGHGIWFDGGEVEHVLQALAGRSEEGEGLQRDVMKFLADFFGTQS